jgi:SPP1 gp7 family putative phage head morphogenesis protein
MKKLRRLVWPQRIADDYTRRVLAVTRKFIASCMPQLIAAYKAMWVSKKDGPDHNLLIVRDADYNILWQTLGSFKIAWEQDRVFELISGIATQQGSRLANQTHQQTTQQFVGLLPIDPLRGMPSRARLLLEDWGPQNAALITKATNEVIDGVYAYCRQALKDGVAPYDLAADIKDYWPSISDARARLIARDQVSKLNGELTMIEQLDVGVTDYIWRTSEDERVRETHIAKNGVRFQWTTPPPDTGHPGWDFQCRCTAEPDLEALTGEKPTAQSKTTTAEAMAEAEENPHRGPIGFKSSATGTPII